MRTDLININIIGDSPAVVCTNNTEDSDEDSYVFNNNSKKEDKGFAPNLISENFKNIIINTGSLLRQMTLRTIDPLHGFKFNDEIEN